jgi:hypothetical protein
MMPWRRCRSRSALLGIPFFSAALAVAALLAVAVTQLDSNPPVSRALSSGGQSVVITTRCDTSGTIVTRAAGAHVAVAARTYGNGGGGWPGQPGHWIQGAAAFSGSSPAYIPRATNHGVLVEWPTGARIYTGIC